METEVVLGIGEEAAPKPSSSEMESAKRHESAEKTLKDDSAASAAAKENGVRVSENGASDSVAETKTLNGSGVIEDCVMNGVSSLLKLKQDSSNLQDDDEEEDEEEEDDEEEHGYQVGDFVWGKIKNHPWWPGQVYDSSDASDLALKLKHPGKKLLVAYFGDGTFAWCGPSQLKPFAESFGSCIKASNSRSFLGAVEEAVESMGRHIERLLICGCAEAKKHKFDNPEAKNAGIKEGVLVPDVRRETISSLVVGKPEGILKDVRCFAETVSFSGLLELEILKRKVSAYYRSKRGYGLTEYHEPQTVPGLEDKNNDDDGDDYDDRSRSRRGGAKRLSKDEDMEEAGGVDPEEELERRVEKCSSAFPDNRLHHRRKQKSIAEILENDSTAKVRFGTEPEDGKFKSSKKKLKRLGEVKDDVSTTPRRRRVREVSTIEDDGHEQVEESIKGKRKKRDDDDENGDREETEKNDVSDTDSTPLASLKKRVKFDASVVEKTAGNGENGVQSSKRERKKSKYFAPEYLSDFPSRWRKKNKTEEPESSTAVTQSQVGEQMTDGLMAVEEDELEKSSEPSSDKGVGHQELLEELSNAVDFLRLGATPLEIRDLIRVAALGTEYQVDSSSEDMIREFMSFYRRFTYDDGANSKFLGSYDNTDKEKEELNVAGGPETEGNDEKREAEQQKPVKQGVDEEEETRKEVNESTKKERKRKKPESKKQGDGEEETRKVASESTRKRKKPDSKKHGDGEAEIGKEASESAKKERKHKKPDSKKHGDGEAETGEEASESRKKERKPRKPDSKKQADGEEETREMQNVSTIKKERKPKKHRYEEEGTRNEIEKPKKKKREGKSEKKETEEEFSGAELYVTFGPGSTLPKKEELVEIYKKFGALEEERTSVLDNNLSARVAFLNIADGEKAFESSVEKCPFASASASTVKFRLKYPNERAEKKRKKAETEVAETTLGMEYVKRKLDEMRSLVDECEGGGMSGEVKVKFEGELGNLLEKVRKMQSSS